MSYFMKSQSVRISEKIVTFAVGGVKFVDGRIATVSILATIISYYRNTAVSPFC